MSTNLSVIDPVGVAARTKLAVLSTGIWQATRLHKGETRVENIRHNTDAARVTVRVSAHHALRDLGKLHDAARREHYRLTLPTIDTGGMRLLPAGREFDHAEQMRKFADEHNTLVAEFVADYPAEYAAAPQRLNSLYDSSVWPNLHEIGDKFTFATRYLPTPTEGTWGEWLVESSRAADDEVRDRLTKALKRVVERCRAEGKVRKSGGVGPGALHATVFDNIRELVELVPDFDFADHFAPVVTAMEPLANIRAEWLRDDPADREQTAQKAESILSVLGGIK
jgi:hypothetical protein